jgi:hypothetical protein
MVLFEFNINDTAFNHNGKCINLKKKNLNLLLSLIANKIICNGVDKNGYTSISSTLLKSTYSRYNIYLDYLIRVGKIERDYYTEGKKCYGYRYSELFKNEIKIKAIIYISNNKKQKPEKKDTSHDCINIDPAILKRLKRDLNSCTINFELTQNQLEKTYDEWDNFIDIGKWFRNNLYLHKWLKGYRTFSFTSNRLYTNFTSLSSHVRESNIKLNGENIVEFDIRNSFPLMIVIYLKNENSDVITNHDFQEYCASVIDGTFYNCLQTGLNAIRNNNKKDNEDEYSTRLLSKSEVKQLFQIYLNGDSKRQPYLNGMRPLINEYMSMKYPCIHDIVLETKEVGKNCVYNALVRIETQFIFSVIKELYEKYDCIKILTCHDAIYVPLSFEERVELIWNEKMKEFVRDLPCDEGADAFELDIKESSNSIFEEDDIYTNHDKRKDIEEDQFFFDEDEDDDF